MTFDEVVAHNVNRLRSDKRLPVAKLAEQLGVKPHVIYDFEGTRKEKPQRHFRWEEIVDLCYHLETNLFELVLPPQGVEIEGIAKSEDWRVRKRTGEPVGSVGFEYDARTELGWILFGIPPEMLTPDKLGALAVAGEKEIARREEIIREMTAEMLRRLDEAIETGEEI